MENLACLRMVGHWMVEYAYALSVLITRDYWLRADKERWGLTSLAVWIYGDELLITSSHAYAAAIWSY